MAKCSVTGIVLKDNPHCLGTVFKNMVKGLGITGKGHHSGFGGLVLKCVHDLGS
jgi:hypothetical protein